jgi:hypothetical protein
MAKLSASTYNLFMAGGNINIDNVVPTPAASEQPAETTVPTTPTSKAPSANRVLLSWSGETFDYVHKGLAWYLVAGLIVLSIIGYLAWQQNWYLIGITVVISAVLFWYVSTARPETVTYAITPFGVQVGEKFYPFTDIHSYWIIYTPAVQKLNIIFNKKYLPALVIDVSKADPNKIKVLLSNRIPEQPNRSENLLDKILRALKI